MDKTSLCSSPNKATLKPRYRRGAGVSFMEPSLGEGGQLIGGLELPAPLPSGKRPWPLSRWQRSHRAERPRPFIWRLGLPSPILRLTTPLLWRNWPRRWRQLPADYHAIAFATAFIARNPIPKAGGFAGLARYGDFFVHCHLAHKPREAHCSDLPTVHARSVDRAQRGACRLSHPQELLEKQRRLIPRDNTFKTPLLSSQIKLDAGPWQSLYKYSSSFLCSASIMVIVRRSGFCIKFINALATAPCGPFALELSRRAMNKKPRPFLLPFCYPTR